MRGLPLLLLLLLLGERTDSLLPQGREKKMGRHDGRGWGGGNNGEMCGYRVTEINKRPFT